MKKIIFVLFLLIQSKAFAQTGELLLSAPAVHYGALSQETNAVANELFVVKRTAFTPKKVKVTFTVNYVVPACTAWSVNRVDLQDFSQVVCDPVLDGTHVCEQKDYSGFYNAQTVCVQQGLVRKTSLKNLTLDFSRAVKLTQNAVETFQVSVKQQQMNADFTQYTGRALQTTSLYRVTTWWGTTVKFVAR